MLSAQWWCSRLWRFGLVSYPNVLEDRGDEVGVLDACDDAQRTAALGAGLDVNGENALQALHLPLLFADKVVKRVKFATIHRFLVGLGHRPVSSKFQRFYPVILGTASRNRASSAEQAPAAAPTGAV